MHLLLRSLIHSLNAMLLQLYIAPVTEHFETKYMNDNSGVWAIKNWLIRTLIRCAYIFFAALIAGMPLCLVIRWCACVVFTSIVGCLRCGHVCICAGIGVLHVFSAHWW